MMVNDDDSYPLVNEQFANLNKMAIELVTLPSYKNGYVSMLMLVLLVYQRVQ